MADKNNYLSRVTYQGGKDSYEFPFSYLRRDFVKAQIDLSESESNTLAYMVDYTIDDHTLKLTKPVDADKTITIYRETSSTPLVGYEDSSILRAYDLNLSQRQNLNILEEQTDIVGKSYSLTQDTKDYMYKNLMDTKTAIDNKMSETLDTVDSKLTTAQADVKKAVSDMNASLDETKQFVNASVSTMNDTVNTTKKSVEDSLAEMNTTVANTKKSVEDSLATTTTNLNDAINTATSSMDSKISQASQELEDAKANLETTKSDIEKALVDTQDSMKATENRVNETKADVTKLADELNESYSSLQDAIKNISATNRNTAYGVGDQIHSSFLPFNCYITCVTAGTTGDTLPVIPKGDHNSGFTYTDGTATFKMDYWPLSINGQKPLNKAGDITINVDKVKEAEKADNATHAGTADNATHASTADKATAVSTTAPVGQAKDLVSAVMAYNDAFRIQVGDTGGNNGYVSFDTGDDGTEPIYFRQYSFDYFGDTANTFGTIAHQVTLLDGNGNTSFPGTVSAPTFSGHLAGTADNATHAGTADNATHAGTADNATHAGTADNADTVDGYHASDLFRYLGGNQTPVITDIFDREGTIDMSTMSDADKATHKANINKAVNMTQSIWDNVTGIHAYGGDYSMNEYPVGTLKLTQSWRNFDKLMIVYTDDDGDWERVRMFDVYEFNYCMENLHSVNLFSDYSIYWYVYGLTKHGTDENFKPSTETILSCRSQKSGIIGIYGIKF